MSGQICCRIPIMPINTSAEVLCMNTVAEDRLLAPKHIYLLHPGEISYLPSLLFWRQGINCF